MNVKRIVWTVIFLGITLAAIVMEIVAAVWHPAGMIPWTEYIAKYVPWPVQLAVYVVLAVWLPFHFWRADTKRKIAYKQGYRDAQRDRLKLLRQMREQSVFVAEQIPPGGSVSVRIPTEPQQDLG